MFTYLAELDLRTFRALTQFGRKHDLEACALKFSASGNGPLYLCLALLMLIELLVAAFQAFLCHADIFWHLWSFQA